MSLRKNIRPISYLKAHPAELISQVNESRHPVIITQKGEARAVLQDAESYESMRKALLMMKLVAQGEADIRAGRLTPQDRVFAEIRRMIREKKRRARS